MRESGCCTLAGSGVLIRWKEVLSCWRAHEEEADRGSRRAAEFTPCLEKAPSCLVPFLLPSPFLPRPFIVPSLRPSILRPSPASPSVPCLLSLSLPPYPSDQHTHTCDPSILRPSSCASSSFSSSSSSCLPASLTPRGQSGRCTRSYLPAAFGTPPPPRSPPPPRRWRSPAAEEPERIALPRGNRDTESRGFLFGGFTGSVSRRWGFHWHANRAKDAGRYLARDREPMVAAPSPCFVISKCKRFLGWSPVGEDGGWRMEAFLRRTEHSTFPSGNVSGWIIEAGWVLELKFDLLEELQRVTVAPTIFICHPFFYDRGGSLLRGSKICVLGIFVVWLLVVRVWTELLQRSGSSWWQPQTKLWPK